jgi:hypothetical protein
MIPVAKEVWDAVEYTAWKQVDSHPVILLNTALDVVSWQVKSQGMDQVRDQMMSKMR